MSEEELQKAKEKVRQIERRNDLTSDEKVARTIKIYAGICAGVAIQPLPFADIFVLTPIQAFMGTRIAAIRGIPISKSESKTIIKEILGIVGLGVMAQQTAIGLYKTFIPFLGPITTIPMVFGLTYAIGKVMDEYFKHKARGENMERKMIKKMWIEELKNGRREGREKRDEIRRNALEKDTSSPQSLPIFRESGQFGVVPLSLPSFQAESKEPKKTP